MSIALIQITENMIDRASKETHFVWLDRRKIYCEYKQTEWWQYDVVAIMWIKKTRKKYNRMKDTNLKSYWAFGYFPKVC